jgi:glycosyltransferase involved in cell wall biosynthesis
VFRVINKLYEINPERNLDLLFLPLHRKIASTLGAEFVFPLRLGMSVSTVGCRFSAVCGTIDQYSKRKLEEYGNQIIPLLGNDQYLTNRKEKSDIFYDISFYTGILNYSRKLIKRKTIIHHAFPLGHGTGFNPAFLLNGNNPKVLGPLLYQPDNGIETAQYVRQGMGSKSATLNYLFIFKKMYEKTIAKSDLIIFDSESTRAQTCNVMENVFDKNYLILPSCGLEVKELLPDNPARVSMDENLRYAVITYLRPRKRVDTVMRALSLYEWRDIHIDIIGDGPSLYYLKRLAKQLLVLDRVNFIGSVKHSETAKYFRSHDAVIHLDQVPHLVNSTSQEALANGTPLIFSETTGLTKYKELPYGWQVDSNNPEILADLFEHISNNRKVLLDKSKNASSFARENLSYKSVGSLLCNEYRKLVR